MSKVLCAMTGRELITEIDVNVLSIESAYTAYLNGDLDPWDLQEIVEEHGFKGWTGQADGSLLVHS